MGSRDTSGGYDGGQANGVVSSSTLGHSDQGSQRDINTVVSSDAVENEEIAEHDTDIDEGNLSEGDDGTDHEGGGKKGVVGKLKKWRQGEKDLHKEHRGVMQMKPARTAEWIKDNVEEGVHHMKDRFAMKSRKPNVETEV